MPTYIFYDEKEEIEWEEIMSISEREQFLKDHPHIHPVMGSPMIVRGVSRGKTDAGWNETLSKIAEAHPSSALANKVNSTRDSVKQTRVNQAVEKWRKSYQKNT